MSDLEEQTQVVAVEGAVLAHDLGDAVEVFVPNVAEGFDIVDVRSDDLHSCNESMNHAGAEGSAGRERTERQACWRAGTGVYMVSSTPFCDFFLTSLGFFGSEGNVARSSIDSDVHGEQRRPAPRGFDAVYCDDRSASASTSRGIREAGRTLETVNFLPHSAQTAIAPGVLSSYLPFFGAACGAPASVKPSSSSPPLSFLAFFLLAAVDVDLRFFPDEGPASAFASVDAGVTVTGVDAPVDDDAVLSSAAVSWTEVVGEVEPDGPAVVAGESGEGWASCPVRLLA